MSIPLPADVRALLERPNFVHLATVDRHGRPQSMAVWCGLEGDNILICTGARTQKAINAGLNPHVALSVIDLDHPYRTAWVRGTVVEIRNDDDLADMDPISVKYIGESFPFRQPGRVTIVIAPDAATARELPFERTPGD